MARSQKKQRKSPKKEKIYCGTCKTLPPGYTSHGSKYACMRMGVGVGLHLARTRVPCDSSGKKSLNKKDLQLLVQRLGGTCKTAGGSFKTVQQLKHDIRRLL